MKFNLYSKDNKQESVLVNLATTFKLGEVNYICYYYNEETVNDLINLYIGKISYGNKCLVINKIDGDKQAEFLSIIKGVLVGSYPKTAFSDYDNIIEVATIVLEGVQKIQIPTKSLDLVTKYHIKEISVDEVAATDEANNKIVANNIENVNQNLEDSVIEEMPNSVNTENSVTNNSENVNQNLEASVIKEMPNSVNTESSADEKAQAENKDTNIIHSSSSMSDFDNLVSENEKQKAKKEEKRNNGKIIRTPILVLLIATIILAIVLVIIGKITGNTETVSVNNSTKSSQNINNSDI